MTQVDEKLFVDGHYRGRPADFTDRIITRRIEIVDEVVGFTGKDFDLVDIGCGNGASSFLLSPKMNSCLGIEAFREHQKPFEEYKKKHGIKNCSFRLMNIEEEEMDRQFDRLISFEVIEHLEKEESVQFYYNVLKDNGLGIISVPNKWWIFETHGAKLPLLPWNRVPFFSWLPKPIHERLANARIYTKDRIRKLLESVGFEILDMKYVTAPMDVLPKGKLKDLMTSTIFKPNTTNIPIFATSIFVVIKKTV